MSVFQPFGLQVPHHTTVRQWILRNGCHALEKPLEKGGQWAVLADYTIGVGTLKCLAIVGVRMDQIEEKDSLTLTHNDVELLGLHVTETTSGEIVKEALEVVKERVGEIDSCIIDEGADVKKGVTLFQKENTDTTLLHDISHKLSNVTKRFLQEDQDWIDYNKDLSESRKRMQQTEFAPLMPPKKRTKGRFMDISAIVDWGIKILKGREQGVYDDISEERWLEYLGWLSDYKEILEVWQFMSDSARLIKGTINREGLSELAFDKLTNHFLGLEITIEELDQFIAESLEVVSEEVDKLKENERLVCSTEVLESIFGKYKEISKGKQGITSSVLGIGAIAGPDRTEEAVKKTMEQCSVKQGVNWIKGKVKETIGAARRRYTDKFKKTKIVDTIEAVVIA